MENNQLSVAKHLSIAEISTIGELFHKSGMFPDIKSAQMAIVKIFAGQELGIPPFASISGVHIIVGKASIGAGLIAGRVKCSGKYDYDVLQHDDKVCELEFFQGKKSLGKSKFTIEDAKKAGTKNIDKFPRNMLFARAMSNGAKWFTPDIYAAPVYTPEEMDDLPNETRDVSINDVVVTTNADKPLTIDPPPSPTPEPATRETIDMLSSKLDAARSAFIDGFTIDELKQKYDFTQDALQFVQTGTAAHKQLPEKPALNFLCANWEAACASIKKGEVTIEEIENVYELVPPVREELLAMQPTKQITQEAIRKANEPTKKPF